MRHSAVLTVCLLAVLAGCTGVPLGDSGGDGTVSLYLSDEENAIDEFAHVNVTVTDVGLKRAWNRSGGSHRHGGDAGNHRHRGRWVSTNITDRTVDVTRLQGENATLLETLSVRDGTYTKTFIRVDEVTGTLTNGTTVDVRLPRDRLKIKDRFRVESGEVTSFVVDITVVERNGEYVLIPRASGSGADVQIHRRGCHHGTHTRQGGGHDGCDNCSRCH